MSFSGKRLLIHCGPAKTGSSALQRAFFDEENSPSSTFLYPAKKHFRRPFQHSFIPACILDNRHRRLNFLLGEILDETEQSQKAITLLSSEFFAAVSESSLDLLVPFAKNFEAVEFVFVVRNNFDLNISIANQNLKTGKTPIFFAKRENAESVERMCKLYSGIRDRFGEKSVRFMKYSGNIIDEFFSAFLNMDYKREKKITNDAEDFGVLLSLHVAQLSPFGMHGDQFKKILSENRVARNPFQNDFINKSNAAMIERDMGFLEPLRAFFGDEIFDFMVKPPEVRPQEQRNIGDLLHYLDSVVETIRNYQKTIGELNR